VSRRWGAERELTPDGRLRFRLIDWSRRRRSELEHGLEEKPRWMEDAPLEDLGFPAVAPTAPRRP
jgi:hypothetical protein